MSDPSRRERIVRSERVVTPEGVRPAAIHIAGETIERVADWEDVAADANVEDVGDSVVMPGVVDSHVHVNEPGRTDWEGFETATSAAAAGGVTTLVDMPLNSIPSTTDGEAFEAKLEAARGQCRVDVGFWGGVVPGNSGSLRELHERGVLGFKCFRIDSGVDEFPPVGRTELDEAMPILADLDTVLLTHAELPGAVEAAVDVWERGGVDDYETFVASRPPAAELEAIEQMIALAERHSCRVHIVHLSASEALEELRSARADGVPVTVETCPHYLSFAAEEIPDGDAAYKCAPPIREAANRDRLWEALQAGAIDLVATDHSPSPPELKSIDDGGLREAWGGIASLQVSLPAVWTVARERDVALEELSRWLSLGPARLAGIDDRKGTIEAGKDADLVAWNPEESFEVRGEELEHRHPVTPYDGLELYGTIERTYVRGDRVYRAGRLEDEWAGEFVLYRADA